MPIKLNTADLESGRAKMLSAAVKKPVPRSDASDLATILREMTVAVQQLTVLCDKPVTVLYDKPAEPKDNSELIDRLVDVQSTTQRTLEALSENRQILPRKPRSIDLAVTERDAWGRISRIKAQLED